MLGAILAVAVCFGQGGQADPATLVEQLGAPRYAARIAAEAELARLGREALPALRAGKTSRDAEIRARSAALEAAIEDTHLLRSTPLTLDFRDVPLAEAIESINRRAGLGLALPVDERATLAGRRVSVRTTGPRPFWAAIDDLCAAASVHPSPGGDPLGPALPLRDGVEEGLVPASDSGPFRVKLAGVNLRSEIRPARPTPVAIREFFLDLVVVAEPRLSIGRDGAARVTTVLDEQGRSLLAPASTDVERREAGYFGLGHSSTLRLRADLPYPDASVSVVTLLRGVIPVVVSARKPGPVVIPLDGSKGLVFRAEGVELTLLDDRPTPGRPSPIQIALRSLGAGAVADPGNPSPAGPRAEPTPQQLEVVDARGEILPWTPMTTTYDGDQVRMTLAIGAGGEATALRYYDVARAKAEVGFEFRDIPIR